MWAKLTPDGILTFYNSESTYDLIKEALDGGWLEAVRTNHKMMMYIDEEGKFKNLSLNPYATQLVSLFSGDYIAGTAVFVGLPDNDGEDTPLQPAEIYLLKLVALSIINAI